VPILSRLVAQIITPVHAAPRLTNLFPKGSADIARRPIGHGNPTHQTAEDCQCANLTVEVGRAPAGRLIPVVSRMTCTALTVATRI
jgi:hypothetical protein